MYLFKRWAFLVCTFIVFSGCRPERNQELLQGIWRGVLSIQGQPLPFNFQVDQPESKTYIITLINGEERIVIDEVIIQGDSLFVDMHIFDTQIRARISENELTGYWIQNYEENNAIPFHATHNLAYRFDPNPSKSELDLTGKWEVQFSLDSMVSVGIFNQTGSEVTGTFLTTMGDYRYLEGNVSNGELKLSTFDGAHAFVFRAKYQDDGRLQGTFYSGKSWKENWVAKRNDLAALPNSDSLTYLVEGYDSLSFSFPDLNGKMVSLTNPKYKNKVVILQIFGTWCPNCLDETKFLADWYDRNHDRGVEIIGLAYEKKNDFDYATKRIGKMVRQIGVNYDFLVAGSSDKTKAALTLPMLNQIMSYPTTIFIDPLGRVRRIHTGFTGPGTGEYYQQFVHQFDSTVDKLISEKEEREKLMADSAASDPVQ